MWAFFMPIATAYRLFYLSIMLNKPKYTSIFVAAIKQRYLYYEFNNC